MPAPGPLGARLLAMPALPWSRKACLRARSVASWSPIFTAITRSDCSTRMSRIFPRPRSGSRAPISPSSPTRRPARHCRYLVGGKPEGGMLWGDAVHLADLQAADPDIGLEYDLDRAIAAATRRNVLAQSAREGWLVSGGHIHGFGRVRSSGSGFEIAP